MVDLVLVYHPRQADSASVAFAPDLDVVSHGIDVERLDENLGEVVVRTYLVIVESV